LEPVVFALRDVRFGSAESLTSLKEKLIKIGAKVVSHGRYVAFQMAEIDISRHLFGDILRLIAELRPHLIQRPRETFGCDAFTPKPGGTLSGARRADVTGFGVPEHHGSAAISTSTSGSFGKCRYTTNVRCHGMRSMIRVWHIPGYLANARANIVDILSRTNEASLQAVTFFLPSPASRRREDSRS
jgi:hypothetical protein